MNVLVRMDGGTSREYQEWVCDCLLLWPNFEDRSQGLSSWRDGDGSSVEFIEILL